MSNLSGYPTRSFKETQKFLVQDPSTGTASLVLGSDLVNYITPNLNVVNAESTRVAAENTDYDVGEVIQTTGQNDPGDGLAAVYLVVEGGTGDFPMLNGNDLLVIRGDDFLREQLASNASGEGSDLVAHTGTSDTVTEALDKRTIYVGSVAELEALSVGGFSDGTAARISLTGRAGDFSWRTGDQSANVTADPKKGVWVAPSSDPTGESGAWKRDVKDSVDWRYFGVEFIGSNESPEFFAALDWSIENKVELKCSGGQVVLSNGYFRDCTGEKVLLSFDSGGSILLETGSDWTGGPPLRFDDADYVKITGLVFDGNRNNVTGNNAGFCSIQRPLGADISDIRITELRRYGINITGTPSVLGQNVYIKNVYGDNIGVSSGGSAVALGELVKCDYIENLTIDGLYVENTSGTGDGQVQKAFNCKNVNLLNFIVTDVGPSEVYPAISNVRNDNSRMENIIISGDCQVAIENNSNVNAVFNNIETTTRKALIMSPDGAGAGDRRSKNVQISKWNDTSTDLVFAFNLISIDKLTLSNVYTNGDVNISRDDATSDKRCEDVEINKFECRNLFTRLVLGFQRITDSVVTGDWEDSHRGDPEPILQNFSFSTSNIIDSNPVVVSPQGLVFQGQSGAIAVGAPFSIKIPPSINVLDRWGFEISMNSYFAASSGNQFSFVKYYGRIDFANFSSFKETKFSGSTTRNGFDVSYDEPNGELVFTNNDTDTLGMTYAVTFMSSVGPIVL